MNRRDFVRLASTDQRTAAYRDYAAECRLMFDELVKVEFTRDESMELLHRILDAREVRCVAST